MSRNKKKESILVVDDSPDTLEIVDRNLSSCGYTVYSAMSVAKAISCLEETPIDIVITDLKMPQTDGFDLLRHVRENFKQIEVVMITGYATVENAVKAVKSGAQEFLSKPFTEEELVTTVGRAAEKLKDRRMMLKQNIDQNVLSFGMIAESKAMRAVLEQVAKAALTPATVLITGESGTGKELIARAIHYSSSRASAPFVPVNCGSIPEGLLESELFGHVKGAFTGAVDSRAGFFQTADGGAIFLDEISETKSAMQVALLRILQDKEVCMIGDSRYRKVDIRIIAATNKDLAELIKKECFREDLYFRLNVITIQLPPLRERGDDIILLAKHFAQKFSDVAEKPLPEISDSALDVLRNYYWPGNVRELESVIQRLVVMSDDQLIEVPDLPSLMRFKALRYSGINRNLAEVEAEHINNVLVNCAGNKTRTAQVLGIDRKTLREKLKLYNISQ